MNDKNLQEIFANYINKFEMINDPAHKEYYKWQIAKRFHEAMDDAINAPIEEFSGKLKNIKKLTENLIDNFTQPFQGLVKYSEHDPETIRTMFRNRYTKDGDTIENKQKRVEVFLEKSHELYPDSYLYKNDMHSVTAFLFLYDPDYNYIFKASHALKFADCIEFYDAFWLHLIRSSSSTRVYC